MSKIKNASWTTLYAVEPITPQSRSKKGMIITDQLMTFLKSYEKRSLDARFAVSSTTSVRFILPEVPSLLKAQLSYSLKIKESFNFWKMTSNNIACVPHL